MPAIFVFAISLLHLTVYVESFLIVVLLCFTGWMLVVNMHYVDKCERAKRERDEARQMLQTLRRMSEIRLETVARIKGFPQ
jgi:hypothetical protein